MAGQNDGLLNLSRYQQEAAMPIAFIAGFITGVGLYEFFSKGDSL